MPKRHVVLERPVVREQVKKMVLEGLSDPEIAQAISTTRLPVTRQAVTAFRRRHRDELTAVIAEVEKRAEDYAIASKVNRIAGLQSLADRVEAVINERGLIERTTTTTEHAEIVRERFARELPAEMRAIYRAAAEELGSIPSAAPNINIDNSTTVIIREVHTSQAVSLG